MNGKLKQKRIIKMFKLFLSIFAVLMVYVSSFGTSYVQAQQFNKLDDVSFELVSLSRKDRFSSLIYGSVEHVSDGDTIVVRAKSGEKIKVRLYAIDAPEKAQPYGPQSAGVLKNLVLYRYIALDVINTDRYGRQVAVVYLDRQDINAEMIKLGAAWHYRYYDKSSNYNYYEKSEQLARANCRGLWNRDCPTPPWEYRKMMREQSRK